MEATQDNSPPRGKDWATLLCAALLVMFAAVLVFAIQQRHHVPSLDAWDEPTGVGDKLLFSLPAVVDARTPVAKFADGPLYAQSSQTEQIADTRVTKAGLDDTRSFFVYHMQNAHGGEAAGRVYYLRVGSGQYLPVSTGPK
jgi:hypothetical protein